MSSSKSGENRTVNSVGKTHFGKWFLYSTSHKEDVWRKSIVDDEQGIIVADAHIQIKRINDAVECSYYIWFSGQAYYLREYFVMFNPGYHTSMVFKFDDIQAAKDFVDKFIERLNNFIAFI